MCLINQIKTAFKCYIGYIISVKNFSKTVALKSNYVVLLIFLPLGNLTIVYG